MAVDERTTSPVGSACRHRPPRCSALRVMLKWSETPLLVTAPGFGFKYTPNFFIRVSTSRSIVAPLAGERERKRERAHADTKFLSKNLARTPQTAASVYVRGFYGAFHFHLDLNSE